MRSFGFTQKLRCATCVFWVEQPKVERSNGQCRRYPPAVMRTDQGLRSMWPLTHADEWCGEHATTADTEGDV